MGVRIQVMSSPCTRPSFTYTLRPVTPTKIKFFLTITIEGLGTRLWYTNMATTFPYIAGYFYDDVTRNGLYI